jgi:hypothetical protein
VERRFAVHAGSHRQALIAAFLVSAATAQAAPKDKDAKKMFDRGVAAYSKGDYAAAAAAMSESYAKEGDPETLFAWAQAEKKLGHCSNAVELYNTLLGFDLPAENKKVIQGQLAECKQATGASDDKPKEPEPKDKKPEKKAEKPDKAPVVAQEEPAHAEPAREEPLRDQPAPSAEGKPWWKDPVGDTLLATGIVGLGVGTVMLVSAHSADSDKTMAGSYTAYANDLSTAHDRGLYGVVGLVAGGALVTGGIVWYATHQHHEHAAVTGWIGPTGGGVALTWR